MMVDVDRERHAAEDLGIGDPALVCAVDGEQDPLRDVVGPAPLQVAELHERVLVRERCVAVQDHDRVLAELRECELRGEQRPERIPVRVLVA